MPMRLPPIMRQRCFSTVTRSAAVPNFYTYQTAAPIVAAATNTTPKLGRIGKWYLPAMAAIAVGMYFLPESLFEEEPAKRTVTLGEINRRIDFSISQQLDEYNRRANKSYQPTLEERNRALLNSWGARSSLEDMERVIAGYEDSHMMPTQHEKNLLLEEAYGKREHIRDVRRAMELYEVQ